MIREAAALWPTVHVAPARFESFVAERASDPSTLCVADLYLACACLDGDATAIALFDAAHLAPLADLLVRASIPPAIARDVQGILRERIFYAVSADGRPKLAEYKGHGQLSGWVRVVAMRTALDVLRKRKLEVPLPPTLEEAVAEDSDDPELAHFKRHYRVEFGAAFEEALASLSPRERNLLRHQLVHELDVDQIGAIYRVHRATAARWVEAARAKLGTEVHARLMTRLRTDQTDVESILRMIRSQVDLSLRRCLTEDEE